MKNPTPFEAGFVAGQTETIPPSAFKMSNRSREYALGFIVGHSESESIQMASPDVAVWTAAELARRYNASPDELLPHMGFDREQTERFYEAYEDEGMNQN